MRKAINNLINNKRVLILGFGREGQSSYRLFNEVGGFTALDIADAKPVSAPINEDTIVISGDDYLNHLNEYDIVMKSPGIVLPKPIQEYQCNITCQADLFLMVYGQQTIGITGTKGKSTTSTLLYHILKENNKEVLFGGNIGIPIFDLTNDINDNTLIVFELSCHQLEYAHYSAHRAIFLNLYEDHLDHYGTVEKYWNAKKNLYRKQVKGDILYCNPEFLPEASDCASDIHQVSISELPFSSWSDIKGVSLRGQHNLLNCAFVYDICKDLGISDEQFISALATFETLPHRLEYIGTKNNVDYYDDSISTTCESAINALKAIDNAGIILLGGMDRGIDYDPLIDFIKDKDLDAIILMYDSGLVIKDKLEAAMTAEKYSHVHYIKELKDACAFAKSNAKNGSAVILSPASASYGVFKNFEQRGDFFKKYIFE